MRIGKVTENVLKRSVFKLHSVPKGREKAAVGTDCAVIAQVEQQEYVSTSAVFAYRAAHAGRNVVATAMNNLWASGAVVDAVELTILLPADAQEPLLKQIMKDADTAAVTAGAYIAGGHTEVSSLVQAPVLTAVALGHRGLEHTGLREPSMEVDLSGASMHEAQPCRTHMAEAQKLQAGSNNTDRRRKILAGYDIIMTGYAGLGGTVLLAEEKAEDLQSIYPAQLIDQAAAYSADLTIQSEAAVAIKSGRAAAEGQTAVHMHDISYGGVYAALWELASRANTGLEVDLKKIPIKQETIEICEFFECNPYELVSTGAMLIATNQAEALVEALKSAGHNGVVIGKLTDSNDRVIVNEEERRFLELPQADEILKVLG